MIVVWALSIGTLLAAARAAGTRSIRGAAASLWVCALLLGAIFLAQGFEYLAITLWLSSTLSGMGFIFFVSLVGEEAPTRPGSRFFAGLVAATFFGCLLLGIFGELSREAMLSDVSAFSGKIVKELGSDLLDREGLAVFFFSVAICLIGTLAATLGRSEAGRDPR